MNNPAAFNLQVSIGAETLFTLFGFNVTNGLLTGLVGTIIAIVILVYTAVSVKRGTYNRFIGLVQWVFEGLLRQINDIIPDKKLAKKMTPLAITIFFVVMFNYWLSVLPGLDSIRVNGIPVLRSSAADLNFTLALAIITVVTVQMYAVRYLGVFGNIKRYIRNPFKDPVGAFEGALEIIGEFSRGVALALRLFGNSFAGEILLIVILLLTSYVASIVLPFFMLFELFIGFIQAYVFFVLTLIFTSLAVTHEAPTHDEKKKQTA
ncbi:MAG: F0F1 ATP synthase subunit A [Candidatus Microsaccharimonas sossegonensis]|uniref:ATP synthase subunit a n=1 Tax=Candidatus Microsaccharimonas sossegonensis TaxID=2506948 RepID=A0A4Q0AHJ8_9BACT|nr:MAG: F0F1 ATP synthase subunit A [Candidatus Microsaccharimonas sossegonensis]